MNAPRVILCDVYGTLLQVLSPPADAEERWQKLLASSLRGAPGVSLSTLAERCQSVVRHDHSRAHATGIRYPEVNWPGVMRRALPELGTLEEREQSDFHLAHMRLQHRLRLYPGAVRFLRACRANGTVLGLVSNAQAYTLRELDEALAGTGLALGDFDEKLTFWSFVEGFSKPDPGVFQLLVHRLSERGIPPHQALMIGDRRDNDIAPARALGFATWQMGDGPGSDGSWADLKKVWQSSQLHSPPD